MNPAANHITRATTMTVEEWVRRYYRPDRLYRHEEDSARRIIEVREIDMEDRGQTVISQYDSTTGRAELYVDRRGVAGLKQTRDRLAKSVSGLEVA